MGPSTRLLIAAALLCAGCPKKSQTPAPCSPGLEPLVELRKGDGTLELSLKRSPDGKGSDVCSPAHTVLARIVETPAKLTLDAPTGATLLTITVDSPADLSASDAKGTRLRVHSEKNETRVLHPDGIAFGAVSRKLGGGTVFDKASVPLAQITERDRDHVISELDGTTRAYVVPSKSAIAAGMFAVPGLTQLEQAALFRALTR
jgi:hypothetical protein